MKIKSKELKKIKFPEGPAFGLALKAQGKGSKADFLEKLRAVAENPDAFLEDPEVQEVAQALIEARKRCPQALREKHLDFKVYGAEGIQPEALNQMYTAMKLPVADSGSLMPDAHKGYGLPIGGVLATKNAVIPYGVGVDIGCRMCLSVFDMPEDRLEKDREKLKKLLQTNTRFGQATFDKSMDHAIFERDEFREIEVARNLRDRAYQQIGSSGGGNHFVEFGTVEVTDLSNDLGLQPGTYLALLSHSGSRGLGANIARYYTKAAMNVTKLPPEARHLDWLELDTDLGQEYWAAMNLAGDYASACHHQIHQRMEWALQAETLSRVENHHNFAWKERNAAGEEVIVHRKGATPAGKGTLGVIPGSMTDPGYIVRGRGIAHSVNSAAHGAGRVMSRTKAKQLLSEKEVARLLREHGVEVLGSGLDEAPMAYKNIDTVMQRQSELVDVLGTFTPKIVRMCGDQKFKEVD